MEHLNPETCRGLGLALLRRTDWVAMNEDAACRILTVVLSLCQVVEGGSGHKLTDFGGHHKSFLHASPLLYDIDGDGVREILAATFDGEVMVFDNTVLPITPALLQIFPTVVQI